MGSALARAAYLVHGGHLDHAPMRLLAWMALAPRDDDATPTYFAGRDQLAVGLGYADASTKAAQSAVKRALAVLVDQGLVERLSEARTGVRQTYRLHIGRIPEGSGDRTPERAVDTPDLGTADRTPDEPSEPVDNHAATDRLGSGERTPVRTADRTPQGSGDRSGWGPLTGPAGDRSPDPLYPRNPRTPDGEPTTHLPADRPLAPTTPVDEDPTTQQPTRAQRTAALIRQRETETAGVA